METNKRKALGKGLEQLFSNESLYVNPVEEIVKAAPNEEDIVEVNISELRSNPYQPRQVFDQEKLVELANSIKEFGVLEPIIVPSDFAISSPFLSRAITLKTYPSPTRFVIAK